MSLKPNIVQAEFLHINIGPGTTLEQIKHECASRIVDNLGVAGDRGPGIKTVLRWLDHDGSVTNLALKFEKQTRNQEHVCKLLQENHSTLRGWWFEWKRRYLLSKVHGLKSRGKNIVLASLHTALSGDWGLVAIETVDNRFRDLREDEVHEMLEAVHSASGMWIFVFMNNYLLSDENTGVACII